MVTKNKFIASENRQGKFNQMVTRIGEIMEVDLKFIRKSAEKMLNDWEEKNHRELKSLFHAKDRARHDEIHKMILSFQRSLEPKIELKHQRIILKKIETITHFWLEDLYFTV